MADREQQTREPTFEGLVAVIQKEDEQAKNSLMEELMLKYRDYCIGTLRKKYPQLSQNDALDTYVEALSRLYLQVTEMVWRKKLTPIRKLGPYLVTICRNVIEDEKNKHESKLQLELSPVSANLPPVVRKLIRKDRLDWVVQGLQKLGDPCRKILELFYFERFSLESIGREVKMKTDAVKVKKHRCQRQLEEILRPLWDTGALSLN